MSTQKTERDYFYEYAQDMFSHGDFNIFKLEKMFYLKKRQLFLDIDDDKDNNKLNLNKKPNKKQRKNEFLY